MQNTKPTTNIVLPTNFHVLQIQQTLMAFPPNVGVRGFPYTLEDLTSKCVKFAANPHVEDVMSGFEEIRVNIAPFDQQLTSQLMECLRLFVQYLVQVFKRFGLYFVDGACPFRFVGFTPVSFDIEVRGG